MRMGAAEALGADSGRPERVKVAAAATGTIRILQPDPTFCPHADMPYFDISDDYTRWGDVCRILPILGAPKADDDPKLYATWKHLKHIAEKHGRSATAYRCPVGCDRIIGNSSPHCTMGNPKVPCQVGQPPSGSGGAGKRLGTVRMGASVSSPAPFPAHYLVNINRFDLVAKVIYAESFLETNGSPSDWARWVYVEHEREFNGFREGCHTPGSTAADAQLARHNWGPGGCVAKTTEADFVLAYGKTLRSIQKHGYREDAAPLAFDNTYTIANGAHRLSAVFALKCNGTVPAYRQTKVGGANLHFNPQWFQSKKWKIPMPVALSDALLLKYIRMLAEGQRCSIFNGRVPHALLLWPATYKVKNR